MLPEALTAIAALGGAAVVEAVATDGWEQAKTGLRAIFRRWGHNDYERIEAQLDEASALACVPGAESSNVRALLEPLWRSRLGEFLAQYPDAAAELEAWAKQFSRVSPDRDTFIQENRAKDGARIYAVLAGDQHIHERETPEAR